MSRKLLKQKIHTIIFEAETPAGKLFDVLLLWAIIISILTVCVESIDKLKYEFGTILLIVEWTFTVLFSIEYFLRVFSTEKPTKYIFSFYGLVDLLAIVPTYLGLYFSGVQSLVVIRSIRLLRIFRLFKLARYVGEADVLAKALRASKHKITVFLITVVSIDLFVGALMYLIEGKESGFTSIPMGMYWAIVTMTTVGYGDIAPQTDLGRMVASLLMIVGYGIIAVPTGIVTAEITRASINHNTRTCKECFAEGHTVSAQFCWNCGKKIN